MRTASSGASLGKSRVTDSGDTLSSPTVPLVVWTSTTTSAGSLIWIDQRSTDKQHGTSSGGAARQVDNDESQRQQGQFINVPRTTRDWAKTSSDNTGTCVAHEQRRTYMVTPLPWCQPKDTDAMATTRLKVEPASSTRNDQQLELLHVKMQATDDETESTRTTQRGTSGLRTR
jgi:hypothetical protein